jgi:hypothetical protein
LLYRKLSCYCWQLDVIRDELVARGLASFPHTLDGLRKDVHALVKTRLKDHRKAVKQAQKEAKKAEKEAKKAAKVVRKIVKVDRSSKLDLNAEGIEIKPVAPLPEPVPSPVVVPSVVEAKDTVPAPSPAQPKTEPQVLHQPIAQPKTDTKTEAAQPAQPKMEMKLEAPQPKVAESHHEPQQPQLTIPSNAEPNLLSTVPVAEPNVHNEQLLSRMLDAIPQLLQHSDLSRTTMRMIRQQLTLSFPEAFVEAHKQEIKDRVSQVIRDMPNPSNNAQNTVIFHPPSAPVVAAPTAPTVVVPSAPPAVVPVGPAPAPQQPFPADATEAEKVKLLELASMGFDNFEINLDLIRQSPNNMDQVVNNILAQRL